MSALQGRLGKQNTVVGDDAHGHAFDAGETANQRGAKAGFEFVKFRAIGDAGNDFPHIKRFARVGGYDAVKLLRVKQRCHRCMGGDVGGFLRVQILHHLARQRQRVHIVLRQMVGHARQAGVHVTTTQIFSAHHLTRGGFDQRRAAQKDGALVFHNDGLVAHGGHIGPACGAAAHDHRNLCDALRAHVRLVEEDAAKVVPVRKDFVLVGQVRATRVHQVNARQVVLLGDLLRPQMLFHRHGVVAAAFDCGVVAHHHAVHATDTANAHNHAGAGRVVVVHVQGGQRCDFQERRAGVDQHLHPLTGQQFAARGVLGTRRLATALGHTL